MLDVVKHLGICPKPLAKNALFIYTKFGLKALQVKVMVVAYALKQLTNLMQLNPKL